MTKYGRVDFPFSPLGREAYGIIIKNQQLADSFDSLDSINLIWFEVFAESYQIAINALKQKYNLLELSIDEKARDMELWESLQSLEAKINWAKQLALEHFEQTFLSDDYSGENVVWAMRYLLDNYLNKKFERTINTLLRGTYPVISDN